MNEELYNMLLSSNFLSHYIKKDGIGMTCNTDGKQEMFSKERKFGSPRRR
jgi:hypothetical protein